MSAIMSFPACGFEWRRGLVSGSQQP